MSNERDFSPNTCTLVFPAGSGPGTTMDCTFAINDDNLVEDSEDIDVLATITSGMASFALGQDIGTINIIDNDGKNKRS